jgi:hypothetical protein
VTAGRKIIIADFRLFVENCKNNTFSRLRQVVFLKCAILCGSRRNQLKIQRRTFIMRDAIRKHLLSSLGELPVERKECTDEKCEHAHCNYSHEDKVYYTPVPVELTDEEILLVMQANSNKLLGKIYKCAMFFVVLTIIGLVLTLIPVIMLAQ